jgi:hypothetical protein
MTWILVIWFSLGAVTPVRVAEYPTQAQCIAAGEVWKAHKEPTSAYRYAICLPGPKGEQAMTPEIHIGFDPPRA